MCRKCGGKMGTFIKEFDFSLFVVRYINRYTFLILFLLIYLYMLWNIGWKRSLFPSFAMASSIILSLFVARLLIWARCGLNFLLYIFIYHLVNVLSASLLTFAWITISYVFVALGLNWTGIKHESTILKWLRLQSSPTIPT